jgi:hypothetical protein
MKYDGTKNNTRIGIDKIMMILLKICDKFYFFLSNIISILIATPMPVPISIPIVREREIY